MTGEAVSYGRIMSLLDKTCEGSVVSAASSREGGAWVLEGKTISRDDKGQAHERE